MKKIIRLTLSKFKRGAYFNFMMTIYMLAMSNKLIAQKAAKFLADLKIAIDEVDEALAIQRKSEFTEEIVTLNDRRHSLLAGIKGMARSLLKVDSTRDDAKALIQLFKDYSIKRSMQTDQATGLFTNLLTDLEGKFASSVKALNLQPQVTSLKEANTQLQKISEERLDAYNNNGTARLADARKKADEAYHRFVYAIESFVLLEGEANYTDFIDRMNTYIKHYKQEALGEKVKEKIPGNNDNQGGGNSDGDEEEPPQG